MKEAHILLAEDNPVNQLLAGRLLEKKGYIVSVASTGVDVLDMLNTEQFDLILMDISMPVMDGMDATRRIRELGIQVHDKDIPIIALSAHALPEDIKEYVKAGMNGFIAKPIEKEDLYNTIDDVLNQ